MVGVVSVTRPELVTLLASARRNGVTLRQNDAGRLVARGTRETADIVRALLARKAEVFQLLPLYRGEVAGLDWHHATVGEPAQCVLCGKPALCREPYDQVPCHKTCVEQRLYPQATHGLTSQ